MCWNSHNVCIGKNTLFGNYLFQRKEHTVGFQGKVCNYILKHFEKIIFITYGKYIFLYFNKHTSPKMSFK